MHQTANIESDKNISRHHKATVWYKRVLALAAGVLVFVVCTNLYMGLKAGAYLNDTPEGLPKMRVGLVLGTSERRTGGGENPYFTYRMKAAADLYRSGKVEILILSGDNRSVYYNEPRMMQRALLKLGVPEYALWMDYAGVRTLNSVWRVRKVFGQEGMIVVSQRFHNERAVFLARQLGLDAYGLNARDVEGTEGFRTHFREVFAKMLALWDLAGIPKSERQR